MLQVIREGVILEKTDLRFENDSVLNPAVYQDGDTLHMYYRAVRHGNYSSVGYCVLRGPKKVVKRHTLPVLFPHEEYEVRGVEDPRIVNIDGLLYMSYTAYDGLNALACLATSTNLLHFERHGILVPLFTYEEFRTLTELKRKLPEKYIRYNKHPTMYDTPDRRMYVWNKNVVFFPRRINGKLCFFHRVKPDIQYAEVSELSDLTREFWEDHFLHMDNNIVMTSLYDHESSYIGAGCPPIETNHGWLVIYHGVHDSVTGYVYCACASLLDLDNPRKEIARLPRPLLAPNKDYEREGVVNNVVFPTGTAIFGDTLYIYYGGADSVVACASVNMHDLIKELLNNPLRS